MNTMTKKELLAVATTLEITGRHDMSKDDLAAAVEAAQTAAAEAGNYVYTAPFRERLYKVGRNSEKDYEALPPQAKKIFDFMSETGICDTGANIVKHAVAAGRLKTQQDPAVLYAFYARKLEDAGVTLANK